MKGGGVGGIGGIGGGGEGGKTIMKAPAASPKPPFILRHDIDTAMLPLLLVRHHAAMERKQYKLLYFFGIINFPTLVSP